MPHHYWLRLALFTCALLVCIVAAGAGYLIKWQIDILVLPHRAPLSQTPADIGILYEEILLTSSDGLQLAGWYIPGQRPEAIILVHGLNSNRQAMLPTAELLLKSGYHILLLELRSHGHSQGDIISYGYREAWDVQAGVDFLAGQPNIEKIGALGVSMGGAAVAQAASVEARLEAVVIQSSYSSLPAAVDDAFDDFTIFPKWPFAPLIVFLAEQRVGLKIGQVNSSQALARLSPRPVLIIHNRNSQLFPVYHAQAMFEAAHQPKSLWLYDSPHYSDPAVTLPAEYKQQVTHFFEAAFAP